MSYRVAPKLFVHLPIIGCLILSGCESNPPIGHDEPVTTSRLVNTRLTDIRVDDLAWQFDDLQVTIHNGSENLPEDVVREITDSDAVYKQVSAAWKYDDTGNALVLTEIEVDGKPIEHEAVIEITPAGPIRVNLGSRQYNMEKVISAAAP